MSAVDESKRVIVEEETRGLLETPYRDAQLQALMLGDHDVMEILRGDLSKKITMLDGWLELFTQQGNITQEQYDDLRFELHKMEKTLDRFLRLQPYIMLNSPLMRLTWIDDEEAKYLKLRVSIMIQRDLITINEEELDSIDLNFFDSLELLCHNAINDSRKGFKAGQITEQRKKIEFVGEGEQKKKRFLLF